MDSDEVGKKLCAMKHDRLVEMFDKMDQLDKLHRKQAETFAQLRRACLHQVEKGMGKVEITPKMFRQLVDGYYNAVERGASQFTWQGRVLLTGYAKYLIEYLTPHVDKTADSQWNQGSVIVAKRRREHEKRTEAGHD